MALTVQPVIKVSRLFSTSLALYSKDNVGLFYQESRQQKRANYDGAGGNLESQI